VVPDIAIDIAIEIPVVEGTDDPVLTRARHLMDADPWRPDQDRLGPTRTATFPERPG
jgi:hypothetical protein